MFSGIIEEIGTIDTIVKKKNLQVLYVKAQKVWRGTKAGDSIAVNGVCLTVTGIKKNVLAFDVILETLRVTSLGCVVKGSKVNLERSLRMNDRISGHFVSGHVDHMATVKKIVTQENYAEFQIGLNKDIRRYIAPKGSIALDGVSLTIGEVKQNYFSVYLIPFTLEVTNLGDKQKGDKVNIETDILAKYVLNSQKDSFYSGKGRDKNQKLKI